MKLTVLLLSLIAHGIAVAGDAEREARLAAEISDSIIEGEPFYLEAGEQKFLAIYTTPDTDVPIGGVIILHGRGMHPNWPDVVYPLRTGLTAHGWETLAIQLPVLEKDATYYDYLPLFPEAFPRIEAAIRFFQEHGVEHVTMVAHSCGAHMGMAWIEATGGPGIDAFVGIGMGATDYGQSMAKPFPLDSMKIPVLDIFGSEEYPAVMKMAPKRLAQILLAGNPRSRQVIVPGADHYFTDQGEPLRKEIVRWLDRLP